MPSSILASSTPVNTVWHVLSWADWCQRLSVSLVTARKRVHAMLDAGTLSKVAVCPACGRTAPGEQCVCGRRMGKGPSYAYALPGEPVPERIRVSVHRRKCRGNATGIKGSGASPELKTLSNRPRELDAQRERPLSRNLDLSRDHGIVYALRRWGWHASQVLDARDDPARWELVTAWVRVVHRMGAKVRNPGAYVARCVMGGKRPRWEPVSASGGSQTRQPARELTQEQRRQRYLEPVEELYRDDEAPASETGAGDARDEVGLFDDFAAATNTDLGEFGANVLEDALNLRPDTRYHHDDHQRNQPDQQRVLGKILPTLLANPRLDVGHPVQHRHPPASYGPSIPTKSLDSVTQFVRVRLEWGAKEKAGMGQNLCGGPSRLAGVQKWHLYWLLSIGPPGPAVNEVGNLTMVLEDYGGPAPPAYPINRLTVRAA